MRLGDEPCPGFWGLMFSSSKPGLLFTLFFFFQRRGNEDSFEPRWPKCWGCCPSKCSLQATLIRSIWKGTLPITPAPAAHQPHPCPYPHTPSQCFWQQSQGNCIFLKFPGDRCARWFENHWPRLAIGIRAVTRFEVTGLVYNCRSQWWWMHAMGSKWALLDSISHLFHKYLIIAHYGRNPCQKYLKLLPLKIVLALLFFLASKIRELNRWGWRVSYFQFPPLGSGWR